MDFENPLDWNEDNLKALIDHGVEERLDLEYKASDSLLDLTIPRKKEEIGKDVSAMANSQGGIIIYGMTENSQGEGKPGLPKELDGKLDPTKISKERLENIILSNVSPRIPNLTIKPIRLDQTNPGKIAYLVDIPQSHTAHQSKDKRYYKRFNFSNIAMEDYEIRDVMHRNRFPIISLSIYCDPGTIKSLRINLMNEGGIAARNIKLILYWPPEISVSNQNLCGFRQMGNEKIDGAIYAVYVAYLNTQCLFPEDEIPITHFGDIRFGYQFSEWNSEAATDPCLDRACAGTLNLKWKVYADDMPPQTGQIDDIYQIPILPPR